MDWVFILFTVLAVAEAVLISSPFDNFRIECPNKSGAQTITIKMAESEGKLRQDTVFSLNCNPVSEIYPWEDIPQGVQDIEREDCQYTSMFDPLMDTNVSFTCKEREYIAGISRVSDTRIQMMCCRMRTREESNCQSLRFGKPYSTDVKTEIQLKGKLINAIGVEENLYKVRFCDLVPRALPLILADVKTRTTKPPTTTSTPTTTTTSSTTTTTTEIAPTVAVETPALDTTTVVASIPEEIKENVVDAGNTVQKIMTAVNINDESLSASSSIDKPNQSPPDNGALELIDAMANQTPDSDVEDSVISPASSVPAKSAVKQKPVQVTSSPVASENKFPSDKDYENMDEAEAELMSSLAEMVKARAMAENIISKVRASGVTQQMNEKRKQMAEELLREIEKQSDPEKADQLFKASVEMLNELAETKRLMSTEELGKEIVKMDQENQQNEQESFEPVVVEDHSPEFLIAAASGEARRAPVRKYQSTLPPLDNFPSPPPSRGHKPADLPRYAYRRPAYVEPLADFEEYDELFKPTQNPSYLPRRPLPTTRHPPLNQHPEPSKYIFPEQPYVDEETRSSPFENEPVARFKPPPPRIEPSNEIFETEEEFIATANPRFRRPIPAAESGSPFEEVRRAPFPRGPSPVLKDDYNEISKTPLSVEESTIARSMSTVEDNTALESKLQLNKDGVKMFKPKDRKPMKLTEQMLKEMEILVASTDAMQEIKKNVETLVPMNAVGKIVEAQTTSIEPPTTTATTTPSTTTEDEYPVYTTTQRTTTDTPYDPSVFYHTVPIRRPKKEKYLTFCTKDLAIRDADDMIVACGDDLDEWYPPRCPPRSSCFMTEDSTFRICCPVSSG